MICAARDGTNGLISQLFSWGALQAAWVTSWNADRRVPVRFGDVNNSRSGFVVSAKQQAISYDSYGACRTVPSEGRRGRTAQCLGVSPNP